MSAVQSARRSFRQQSRFYPRAASAAVFVPWLFNVSTKMTEAASATPLTFADVRRFVTLFNSMMQASPWRASIRRFVPAVAAVEGGAA